METTPKALRTHILRLLGPKTKLCRGFRPISSLGVHGTQCCEITSFKARLRVYRVCRGIARRRQYLGTRLRRVHRTVTTSN